MKASRMSIWPLSTGLLSALGQCVGKHLVEPIAGTADGTTGTADTAVADLSREHQFAKSTIFRLGLLVDHVLTVL